MGVISANNTYEFMAPVRVVSTANIAGTYFNGAINNGVGATLTLTATGALTIDSVALAVNDRVLLAGQSSALQNGCYVVINAGASGVSAVLQRSGDFQSVEQMKTGQVFAVQAGTIGQGSAWTVVESLPASLGVSNIVFAAVSVYGTYTTSVTLSQAQIQGAYATPVQLLAAPGAGNSIMVLNAVVYTNFQTAAFANGGAAIVQYANTVHGAGTNTLSATIPAAEITAAASQIYSLNQNTGTALTGITNVGVFFSNATGAFTAGNAASTVVITLTYQIIPSSV